MGYLADAVEERGLVLDIHRRALVEVTRLLHLQPALVHLRQRIVDDLVSVPDIAAERNKRIMRLPALLPLLNRKERPLPCDLHPCTRRKRQRTRLLRAHRNLRDVAPDTALPRHLRHKRLYRLIVALLHMLRYSVYHIPEVVVRIKLLRPDWLRVGFMHNKVEDNILLLEPLTRVHADNRHQPQVLDKHLILALCHNLTIALPRADD